MNVEQTLLAGVAILEPNLTAHDFAFGYLSAGPSSGGEYASCRCVHDDRSVNISYRYGLGDVHYVWGATRVSHADLASAFGIRGDYPGYPTTTMIHWIASGVSTLIFAPG